MLTCYVPLRKKFILLNNNSILRSWKEYKVLTPQHSSHSVNFDSSSDVDIQVKISSHCILSDTLAILGGEIQRLT